MILPSLLLLTPGLVMLGAALLILLLDLLLRPAPGSAREGWFPAIAALGAAGSVVATLLLGSEPARIYAVLQFDAFTAFSWTMVSGSLVLIVMLSVHYIRVQSREPALYYAALMFLGIAAHLLIGATNTIMLLLALDFLSLVSYFLTGYLHYDKRSTEAALKYLVYGAAISALMAFGLSWAYGLTGTTDYAAIANALTGGLRVWGSDQLIPVGPLLPALIFVLAGLAFKVGAAPFHQWVPDAYEGAPTPITAALAIVPKLAGIAAIVRITFVMLPEHTELGALWRFPLITLLAVAAMLFGNLAGLWQQNIKRLMGYSGIAQMGYVLLGVTVANAAGVQAVLLYLVAYVVAELGVFAAVTVVSERLEQDQIVDYRSLYHRAPALALALLVALFSLGGVPGTGGFMGKLFVFSVVLEDQRLWLLLVAAINTVISLAYYWKVIRAAFVHADVALAPIRPPWPAAVVSALALVGILAVGIYPRFLLAWVAPAVRVFFP